MLENLPWKDGSVKPTRVLILDDESTLRTALFRLLDRKGYQVVTAQRLDEARTFMTPEKPFDIAIIDHRPGFSVSGEAGTRGVRAP